MPRAAEPTPRERGAFLKSLYVSGFKSFSSDHPQMFSFVEGMNVVSGANGAGKSNVLDAILFGLTSPEKDLRVTRMRQLLHSRGSQQDKCATVELTFETTKGTAVLSARLYRDSDERRFKLHGKTRTITEVRRWLSQNVGIDMDVPSFAVMQNTVIAFLSKSPIELAAIISQATGTDALRKEIKEAARFLCANTAVSQIEDELDTWGGAVAREKSRLSDAAKALRCEADLASTEKRLAVLSSLEFLWKTSQELAAIADCEKREADSATALAEARSKEKLVMLSLQELAASRAVHMQDAVEPAAAEAEKVRDDLEAVDMDITHTERSITEAAAAAQQHADQIQSHKRDLQLVKAEMVKGQDLARVLQDAVEQAQSGVRMTVAEQTDLVHQTELLEAELGAAKREVTVLEEYVQTTKNRVQKSHVSGISHTQMQLRHLQERVAEDEDAVDDVRQRVTQLKQQLSRFRRLSPDIGEGTVLDLLELRSSGGEWTEALQAAMGSTWGYEVCQHMGEVKELLRLAKEQRRVTEARVAAALAAGAVFPHTLISYKACFAPVVEKLFFNVVFAEEADTQALLSLGYSVLTRDGTMHHAGGNRLTGGYSGHQSNPLSARASLSQAVEEEESITARLRDAGVELAALREQLLQMKALEKEYEVSEAKRNQSIERLFKAQSSLSDLARSVCVNQARIRAAKVVPDATTVEAAANEAESLRQRALELESELKVLEEFGNPDCTSPQQLQERLSTLLQSRLKLLSKQTTLSLRQAESEAANSDIDRQAAGLQEDLGSTRRTIDAYEANRKEAKAQKVEHARLAAEAKKHIGAADPDLVAEAEEFLRLGTVSQSDARLELEALQKKQMALMFEKEALAGTDTTDTTMAAVAGVETAVAMLECRRESFAVLQERASIVSNAANLELVAESMEQCDQGALQSCNASFTQYLRVLVPKFERVELRAVQKTDLSEGVEVIIDESPLQLFSGGQKTLIALAFLLAVAAFHAAPFYLLDEVDAALDETNQGLIAHLVASSLQRRQVLCITHHPSFRQHADRILHLQNKAGASALSHTSVKKQT
eukprot:TRINITY_DN16336_c0_g1_i1.p1 TRINITY_DN16336_c0_g1~~TRINITY_DN16336_c0_g1_i1.p1  ORF type:complete len:1063 (+),score=210.15 TRINITY_DN16336_c0_g1_i1:2311-5499(+)